MVTVIVIFCIITAFVTFHCTRVRYRHKFFDKYRQIINAETILNESLDAERKLLHTFGIKDDSRTFMRLYRMARWLGYDIVLVRRKDASSERHFVFPERKRTRIKMANIKMFFYRLLLKYSKR